jgi:hypothetical protein
MKAKSRSRHGLLALKARVKVRGLKAIDMRTQAAQGLVAFRTALLNALGGPDNVSPQKAVLIEMVVRTKLYIDSVDSFILSQDSLVNRRKKAILPIVRERQSLVDSLERLLSRIGLDRVPAPVEDLNDYLARKAREKEALQDQSEVEADDVSPDEEPQEEHQQ